jgi:DNA-binding transcriptional LysR family regulator
MSEFTLAGLRVVVAVARAGTFSGAAEALGYTQSAVSRQIAQTERAAGAPLFTRHARGVRPTAAGDVLVRHAATVLEGVASASQELAGMRDRLAGRLAVGAFPVAAAALAPRAIARLRISHPGIQVRLTEASTPAQLTALRKGRLEVAVVAAGAGLPDYDLDGLTLTKLESGRGAGIAVSEAHPLAVRDRVTPADLHDQPWIVGDSDDGSPQFEAWPELVEPLIAYTAKSWPARLGLVAAGLGIALVPGIAADTVPASVRWIPIVDSEHSLGRTAFAATLGAPTPAADAFCRELLAELRSWPAPG